MKTRLLPLFALCSAVAGSGLSARAAQAETTTTTQTSVSTTIPASGAPRFSGRINDVVALSQSGVDQSVVLSYIKNSPGPFQPSADEIIKLRDTGIPAPVITAILQRGGELRDQAVAAAAAQNQTYAQSSSTYSQPAQTTVVTPPATYVDPTYNPYYTYPSSSVVYIGGSYGYPYYYNYSYPYYYPYYSHVGFYGPRFSFNFGSPFRFGGGFHGRPIFGGGFHGGFGGGFHGGGGGFHTGGGGFHGGGGGFHGGMHH